MHWGRAILNINDETQSLVYGYLMIAYMNIASNRYFCHFLVKKMLFYPINMLNLIRSGMISGVSWDGIGGVTGQLESHLYRKKICILILKKWNVRWSEMLNVRQCDLSWRLLYTFF